MYSEIGFISERKRARSVGKEFSLGRKARPDDFLDVVASVSPAGMEAVFDLSISGEPVFGAGGILVHNCDPVSCFLHSGKPRFNNEGLVRLEAMARSRLPTYGNFDQQRDGSVVFRPCSKQEAFVQVWELPKVGCRYLMSIDAMTGEDQTRGSVDPDHNSLLVWRDGYIDENRVKWNPMLVARITPPNIMEATPLIEIGAPLARWYGNCMVVPEVNKGLHVLEACKHADLEIYRRTAGVDRLKDEVIERVGWQTDQATRLQIIENLSELVRTGAVDIYCPTMVAQMRTFVRNAAGRPEAAPGCKDDDVMCGAIGLYCLPVATKMREPARRRSREERDDYA